MKLISRLPDWFERLIQARSVLDGCKYRFGYHDCFIRHLKIADAMTGSDITSQWIGKYSTPQGALRLLKRSGFDEFRSLLGFMFPECSVSEVRVGDLALVVDAMGGEHLALCLGTRFETLLEEGLLLMEPERAYTAYRIG